MHDKNAYSKAIDELVRSFQTNLEVGLTRAEAQDRFDRFGANELLERVRPGFLALLLNQFNNFLVIILIVAALISLALGEYVDSVAIMVIVLLNAVVGVIQEAKAEEALAALKKMAAPNAQVIRDGRRMTPYRKTSAQITRHAVPSSFPRSSSACCKGVCSSSVAWIISAIKPICVCIPVALTTPRPRP